MKTTPFARLRALIGQVIAIALAVVAIGVTVAPAAQAANEYTTETYRRAFTDRIGVNYIMEVYPLHKKGDQWFAFDGEAITGKLTWSAETAEITGAIDCGMDKGERVWDRKGTYRSMSIAVSFTARSQGDANWSAFCDFDSTATWFEKHRFWWLTVPNSVTPAITKGLTGGGRYKAGTQVSGDFAYSHKTLFPFQAPSVGWTISPNLAANTFQPDDKKYKFTPRTAGTYTITAKINGGARTPSNLTTAATIVVTPGDISSVVIKPKKAEAKRGETVMFDVSVQDAYSNVITTNASDMFFASTNSTDTPVLGGMKFGSGAGRRTITGTYSTRSGAHQMDVLGEPVISALEPISVMAGETYAGSVTMDAYPAKVTVTCIGSDALKSLTWTAPSFKLAPTVAGKHRVDCVASNTSGASPAFPMEVTVTPAPTVSLAIDQAGAQPTGKPIALSWTSTDAHGNKTDASRLKIAAIASTGPSDRIHLADRAITLVGDGPRTVTVTVIDPDSDKAVTGVATLVGSKAASGDQPSGDQDKPGDTPKPGGTPKPGDTPRPGGTPKPGDGTSNPGGSPNAPTNPGGSPNAPSNPGGSAAVTMPGLPAGQAGALTPVGAGGTTHVTPGTTVGLPSGIVVAPAAVSYQWYRGSKPISGATGATYKIKPADAGHKLTVKVTRKIGNLAETFNLKALSVPKLSAKIKLSPRVSGGRPAVLIKVSVAKLRKPTGKIVVQAAGERKVVSLKAKHKGKIVVPLSKMQRGKTTAIKVTYRGSTQTKKASVSANGLWQ
ncbi:MAG: hypothetical protein LBH48_06340 [Bifidobacteriaceae bacterium]|jgi:hypothetical protein|nr:hypothetical protein [Bifidobacteriaceae bacterium]